MENGGLRNLDQIQEREHDGGGRLGGLVLASLGCACLVFAAIALLRKPTAGPTKAADPLDALVAKGPAPASSAQLSASDVTFPSMLSDSLHPTTALAALQGAAPGPSGSAVFVLPPGIPSMPPPPGDRLPVVPMPAQRILGASPVVTDPRDPLTTMAKDQSTVKGSMVDEGHAGPYNLQVASFKTEPEAQGFSIVLRQRGHHAYIESANIPNRGMWYRVRIGPFKYLRDATKYRNDFETREHIVPFVIETEKEKKLAEQREFERQRNRDAKRRH